MGINIRGRAGHEMNLSAAAHSGDGSLAHVGMNMRGTVDCLECSQRFSTEEALILHVKYMHGNRIFRVIMLTQEGNALVGMTLGGTTMFRVDQWSANVRELKEQVSKGLKETKGGEAFDETRSDPAFLTFVTNEKELRDDVIIEDISSTILKQDLGIPTQAWD